MAQLGRPRGAGSPLVPMLAAALFAVAAAGCGEDAEVVGGSASPSDDPRDHAVDTSVDYRIEVSEPRWVIPGAGLPADTAAVSNANVEIHFFGGKLYMAWRAAPFHFASSETKMQVVSSTDGGETWDLETTIALGRDVREPRLFDADGELHLVFFEAGTNALAFEPNRMLQVVRDESGRWSDVQVVVDAPEVPWDIKRRIPAKGEPSQLWMTSYMGEHYGGEGSVVQVFFKHSSDGYAWSPVAGDGVVYSGGVSEVAFEFTDAGDLWAVTRNEDGDATGCGSQVCVAKAGDLGNWDCPDVSDPERYDSPEMFRHGNRLYLIARRDIGGPFGAGPDACSLVAYSQRAKTTALYEVDTDARRVVHIQDLPGAGDTAFASVRRVDDHHFLVANYTAPLDEPDQSWVQGQTSDRGTQVYFVDIRFVAP
ncbi:MAG: exo-alpha-sialidase [Myxococcales bacterium]|nr:exo-alpha-sialidase [Myxococcales bacterium]